MQYNDSEGTILLRQKLNNKKSYLRDIIPNKDYVKGKLSVYKSNISLKEFDSKLYIDPIFSQDLVTSTSTYSVLKGSWTIDEETDDIGNQIVKLIDNKSGQSLKIAFPDAMNKIKFLNEMNVTKKISQESSGIGIENIVNKNIIYPKKKIINAGIMAILAGITISAILKRNKKNINK